MNTEAILKQMPFAVDFDRVTLHRLDSGDMVFLEWIVRKCAAEGLGFFTQTNADIQAETGLGIHKLKNAITRFTILGILHVEKRSTTGKRGGPVRYLKFDYVRLSEIFDEIFDRKHPMGEKAFTLYSELARMQQEMNETADTQRIADAKTE